MSRTWQGEATTTTTKINVKENKKILTFSFVPIVLFVCFFFVCFLAVVDLDSKNLSGRFWKKKYWEHTEKSDDASLRYMYGKKDPNDRFPRWLWFGFCIYFFFFRFLSRRYPCLFFSNSAEWLLYFVLGSFVVVVVVVSICFLSAFRKTNDFEKNRWNERHSLRVYRGPGSGPRWGPAHGWGIESSSLPQKAIAKNIILLWGVLCLFCFFFFRFKGKKKTITKDGKTLFYFVFRLEDAIRNAWKVLGDGWFVCVTKSVSFHFSLYCFHFVCVFFFCFL